MSIGKKVLVTGGAGFIGSHVCEHLLKKGNKVICLDNFTTGRIYNVNSLLNNENFTIVKHDIVDEYTTNVDEIYNLACPASPIQYQKDSIKTIKTNVIGCINMLELAKKNKAKILQASTSEIYGDPQIHPQDENYYGYVNPIGLRSCYDEGKRCAESLFFSYHFQKSVNIRVVRIFNTYGPKMLINDGRVVSNFIVQALKGEDITVYGDGLQTRSFCYIDDLVDGMIKMMNAPDKIIGPVNLGSNEEFTVLDLAKKIIHLTGSSSKIVFRPLPKDDPRKRRPNIELAKKVLNWKPKVSLDEGLMKTIKYFKSFLNKSCNN